MTKKQIKEDKPRGFNPNIMLMIGGLQKFTEDNNYSVEKARMFYSVLKASMQDSFNTWASTHTIADLPMVNTINDYDKKEDVSAIFKDLKGDIIQFLETQACTSNVENFMISINEVSTNLDNKIITQYAKEEAKNYK
jgi:hypothetical protein